MVPYGKKTIESPSLMATPEMVSVVRVAASVTQRSLVALADRLQGEAHPALRRRAAHAELVVVRLKRLELGQAVVAAGRHRLGAALFESGRGATVTS